MAREAQVYSRVYGDYGGISVDLELLCNITMLIGDSSTGKTFLCEILRGLTDNYFIKVFDYRDRPEQSMLAMKKFIKETKGCLVVLDNSDLLLLDNEELINIICLNDANQYLFIGRNPNGLGMRTNNFMELKFEDNKFTLIKAFE